MTRRDGQLRRTRTFLVVCGVLLVAAAVVAALLSFGWVDRLGAALRADGPLWNADGRSLVLDHQLAWQVAALVLGVILVAIGLTVLRWQLPPVRHQHDDELPNPDEARPGRNVVEGGALAAALEADLERSPLVERARVEVRPDDQRLWLRLDVDRTADVEGLVHEVVEPAVARFLAVAALDGSTALTVDLRPVEAGAPRVA